MRFGAAALLLCAAAAAVSPAAARPATGLRGLLNPRHHRGVGLSGMEVEVSQKLLDYGATILNELIAIELSKTTIPEISGKKDGFKCASRVALRVQRAASTIVFAFWLARWLAATPPLNHCRVPPEEHCRRRPPPRRRLLLLLGLQRRRHRRRCL